MLTSPKHVGRGEQGSQEQTGRTRQVPRWGGALCLRHPPNSPAPPPAPCPPLPGLPALCPPWSRGEVSRVRRTAGYSGSRGKGPCEPCVSWAWGQEPRKATNQLRAEQSVRIRRVDSALARESQQSVNQGRLPGCRGAPRPQGARLARRPRIPRHLWAPKAAGTGTLLNEDSESWQRRWEANV